MTYTEIQEKNGRKYYYRVKSIKKNKKVTKIRNYLGVNLAKKQLNRLEKEADKVINKSLDVLLTKKEREELIKVKEKYKKERKETFQNRYESFVVQFTYDSNAIEGSTLSLQETSYLMFENRTPKGKSLREINEVLNHKKAFDYMLDYKKDINKKFICDLQKIIVENTLKKNLENQIGRYRDLQVYIRGAKFVPPKPKDVKKDMANLLRWYIRNKNKLHPIITSAYFHSAFESIHPFVDGNGRTGRLLMNFILHKYSYPMINIPNKIKLEYVSCLEEANKGDLRKFVKFLFDLLKDTEVYV